MPQQHSIDQPSHDFVKMADPPAPTPTLPQVVNELKILHARVSELSEVKKVAENLSTQVTLLLQQANAPAQGKKQQLPAPPTFDGSKWDTWKPYVKAKMDVDGVAIGPVKAQFWYLYGCLDAKIQSMVLPLAEQDGEATPEAILATLARIYDDPNKKEKAAEKLTKMRQHQDEAFSAYLARFERTLYQADAQSWPDPAKLAALRTGLSNELKKKLEVQLILPTNYHDFVKALHQLAHGAPAASSAGHSHGNWNKEHKSEPQINTIGAMHSRSMKELLDAPSSDEEDSGGQDN